MLYKWAILRFPTESRTNLLSWYNERLFGNVTVGAPSSASAFEQGLGDVEDLVERLHRAEVTHLPSAPPPTLVGLTTPEPDPPQTVSYISRDPTFLTVLPWLLMMLQLLVRQANTRHKCVPCQWIKLRHPPLVMPPQKMRQMSLCKGTLTRKEVGEHVVRVRGSGRSGITTVIIYTCFLPVMFVRYRRWFTHKLIGCEFIYRNRNHEIIH